jgi:hypothetical protein
MAIPLADWLDLIGGDYLDSFIPAGGAAMRIAVSDAEGLDRAATGLALRAERSGLQVCRVSLAETKLHLLQTFFFAVAQELPWDELIRARAERMVTEAGYAWPTPGQRTSLNELAAANGIAAQLLGRQLLQWLTQQIWQDPDLTQDFRSAAIALVNDEITGDNFTLREAVLGWLRGERRRLAELRPAGIGARITRHNARATLMALCHFLRSCGRNGLLVLLDIRRLHQPRAEEGLHYTPAAVMDCYEVLRQVIDDIEHFPGLFLAVLADGELLSDHSNRSLRQYDALRMRVIDDVRPHGRDNPLSPLVRLEA